MNNPLLRYWCKRLARLTYVIDEVAQGRKEVSDRQYDKLVSAIAWCEENIEAIEDELDEAEELAEKREKR